MAARLHIAIEARHEIVVDGHGHALHNDPLAVLARRTGSTRLLQS